MGETTKPRPSTCGVWSYFRLSMNVRSVSKKVPNAKKDMIVWKVSICTASFPEGCTHKLVVQTDYT